MSRFLTCMMAIASCLLAHIAGANGFRNPPEGARALALGARSVMVDDASAIAHNPANLLSLEQPEVLQSMTFGYSRHRATLPDGSSSATTDNLKILPNLFAAMPFGEGVIGLGITTPYGQSTVWDRDSVFKYQAPYFSEMRLVNLNPTYAWRLADQLAIGLGLDIFLADLSFKQEVPWSQVVPGSPDGEFDFYGKGYGIGGNIGFSWEPAERHLFALTYHTPVRIEFKGDLDVKRKPAPLPGSARSDFETAIQFPAKVAIGYGFEARPDLKLGVQVEWVEFSRHDEIDIDAGSNQALLPAAAIPQDWNDIWTFGFGCEWQINPTWALRGGYDYLPSPIPNSTHSPIIPDSDRHVLSFGAGYTRGRHTLDVTYAYSIFEDRSVSGSFNPAYNADWDLEAHLLVVSYGFAF